MRRGSTTRSTTPKDERSASRPTPASAGTSGRCCHSQSSSLSAPSQGRESQWSGANRRVAPRAIPGWSSTARWRSAPPSLRLRSGRSNDDLCSGWSADGSFEEDDRPCDQVTLLERESDGLPALRAQLVQVVRPQVDGRFLESACGFQRDDEVLPLLHVRLL